MANKPDRGRQEPYLGRRPDDSKKPPTGGSRSVEPDDVEIEVDSPQENDGREAFDTSGPHLDVEPPEDASDEPTSRAGPLMESLPGDKWFEPSSTRRAGSSAVVPKQPLFPQRRPPPIDRERGSTPRPSEGAGSVLGTLAARLRGEFKALRFRT